MSIARALRELEAQVDVLMNTVVTLEREREADRALIRELRDRIQSSDQRYLQEREADRAAIRAWLDYFEPYFKERSVVNVSWRVFRDWKEKHSAAISRATGHEGAK